MSERVSDSEVAESPGTAAVEPCAACGATIDPAQAWCWLCQTPLGEAAETVSPADTTSPAGDVVEPDDATAVGEPAVRVGSIRGVRSLLGRDLPARRAAVLMAGCVGLAIALSSPFVLIRDEPLPQAPTSDGSLQQGVVVPDDVLDQP